MKGDKNINKAYSTFRKQRSASLRGKPQKELNTDTAYNKQLHFRCQDDIGRQLKAIHPSFAKRRVSTLHSLPLAKVNLFLYINDSLGIT
jgi:hypothetical protein